MMDINSISARAILLSAVIGLFTHSASAKWTVTTEGAPSGCNRVISDGNWKIGVFKNSESNWTLGKQGNGQGTALLAGSGDLDLSSVEADCGVRLVSASNGALEKNSVIFSARLPDSLETALGNTFNECKSLTNVVLGTGFKTTGERMFRYCSALKTVTFNNGIESIGNYGFSGCSSLEWDEFTFPASLKTLGDHAFEDCTKIIGTVTFPGVTNVTGSYHFEDCTAMTNFVAPRLVTTARVMFNRCRALKSASFSPDLETIVAQSFEKGDSQDTPQLESFFPTNMPKLKTFGEKAFRGQKLLVGNFDFSLSAITELPYYAFVDDEKVGNVYLPEGLTNIRGAALGYGKKARVVWFCGPPPAMYSDALNPKGGNSWVLVAGRKHAAEWKSNDNVETITDAERATAKTAAESFGLKGFKPIGKWTYQTGGYTHWVVEEPISGLITVVR